MSHLNSFNYSNTKILAILSFGKGKKEKLYKQNVYAKPKQIYQYNLFTVSHLKKKYINNYLENKLQNKL